MKTKIKCPPMRLRLIDRIDEIRDEELHKTWPDKSYAHAFWDSLCFSLVEIDDLPFETYPQEQIGMTIYNQQELNAVLRVVEAGNILVKKVGTNQPDDVYINSPYVQALIDAAKDAYNIMINNELPMWKELMLNIGHLSPAKYRESWIDPNDNHSFSKHIKQHIDFFDKLGIEKDPQKQIGYSVFNEEELNAALQAISALRDVLKYVGENKENEAYTSSPYWQKLIKTADAAYDVFMRCEE